MNINSQNVSEAENALKVASKDLIAFGKLFVMACVTIISYLILENHESYKN